MECNKKVLYAVLPVLITVVIVVVVTTITTLNNGPTPDPTWITGDYIVGDINFAIVNVDNDSSVTYRQLKFLDSEYYAYQPMYWVGGDTNDTMVITLNGNTKTAKITPDKKTIYGGPGPLASSNMTWITPEEADIINNREKESISAPKVPYPLQPGKLGKFAFITGPPGSGKSTVAGIIAKDHDWIYYEGDGFFLGFNPYVFPNESQVNARSDKPALIGEGMAARGGALVEFLVNQEKLSANVTSDRSPTDRYYTLMAKDILKERKRVGGDWVVVFAMAKRVDRDVIRKVLGNDLTFVVLDISLDLVIERLKGRGEGEEHLAKEHNEYEPAQEDEPNTISFEIKKEATREQNAQAVYDLISSKSNEKNNDDNR